MSNQPTSRVRRAYGRGPLVDTAPVFYVGLDLGQATDPTALAIISCEVYEPKTIRPIKPEDWIFDLVTLERFPLGTPYPKIVDEVTDRMRILRADHASRAHLIIDRTGVGRAVVDMFEERGLRPIALTYTAGNSVTKGDRPRSYGVPKRDLVGAAQVTLQTRRLRIAAGLPLARVFKEELQNFKVKFTPLGHDAYEAVKSGAHDDLVCAVCQCIWAARAKGIYLGGVSITFGSIWI